MGVENEMLMATWFTGLEQEERQVKQPRHRMVTFRMLCGRRRQRSWRRRSSPIYTGTSQHQRPKLKFKRRRKLIAQHVCRLLGNKPTESDKTYIAPEVYADWTKGQSWEIPEDEGVEEASNAD